MSSNSKNVINKPLHRFCHSLINESFLNVLVGMASI